MTSSKKVPAHIPAIFTTRQLLTHHVEIRTPPKKSLLRALVPYTSSSPDRRRLSELCARQGGDDYARHVRERRSSIADVLAAFPSCQPPLALVVQHLPRLQPRRYSFCSSPLDCDEIHIAFNVVRFPADDDRDTRDGVCTGWLERDSPSTVDVFPVASTGFRLPDDANTPIVMIGPGVGVAPFVGFLRHRRTLMTSSQLGEAWLFTGCRHRDRDHVYGGELSRLRECGALTHLHVAFSRDDACYVQDDMRACAADLRRLVTSTRCVFYVCGDARNMARDVRACIIGHVIGGDDAEQVFERLLVEKRYREDVWA